MKQKWADAFMDTAERFAELSSAKRLHVGAVVVKDDRIISIGYNGMPSGWDNNCEFVFTHPQTKIDELVSRKEVLHAETNAIAKLAKSNESGLGATMFITHAPCLDCAKLIFQSGISSVLYRNSYRDTAGIDFLKKCNVEIEKLLK
ncbi:ComEB Deoxycytidylate deaminase [uncultured Caudovirales phage]|uniref:ComEB Deoxycytidylate deaminase n=1 Tax=uncultured Caudovirales phage TaxID=2100421 RepID=A0A6J7X1C7_9CAUD|nr:ComEB Deoxycytidylate deaminase [uncultured Caudovirales phage]